MPTSDPRDQELPPRGAIRRETLQVSRTARLAILGPEGRGVRELWYVLHGYGQLAEPFLEDCRALDDGTRLIVAPEALSRFYDAGVEERMRHGQANVGATWMTREARDDEIADYLAYLDAVHAFVSARLPGVTPRVTVLGFSQGGATASRWVARGTVPTARLVLWGSTLAPELDIMTPASPLRRAAPIWVIGTRDAFATPKIIAKERTRLEAAGFPFRFLSFDGGHRLDDQALRDVAAS